MKRWIPLVLFAALVSLLIPIALVGAEAPKMVYFPQTSHNVGEPFLKYWRENGGLAQFGYPLTEPVQQKLEDGKTYTVQYFERARFEAHPENNAPFDVLLGQFGRQYAAKLPANKAFDPVPQQPSTATNAYFPETKHTLQDKFLTYWNANGGLAQFGYPLTEQFQLKLEDGKTYTVQFFERARFEAHPENQAPFDVLLGQFGRQAATDSKAPMTASPRQANAPDYDESLFYTPTPTATATPIPTPTPTPKPEPTDPRPDLGKAYIEVNISAMELYVWENGKMIYSATVSTGRPGWETPTGVFYINSYVKLQDMEGGGQKGDPDYYFQPDVPWVMYFDYNGDAIHGVYWHNNFGLRNTSHGCVGVPVDVAKWIWDWSSLGTPVWIHY